MVSPRKSRRKSLCFSSTTTPTPARASRKPSIMPAGPPPAMQQVVWMVSVGIFSCCHAREGGHPVIARVRVDPPTQSQQISPLLDPRLRGDDSRAHATPSFFCRLVDDVVYWNTNFLSG